MQELHTQSIEDVHSAEAEERLDRHVQSNSTLDSLILSRLDDDGRPISPEPVKDFEDFVSARPYLEELKERHGTDTAGVLDKFSYYNTELKKHGDIGAELLRGDYLANTNMAKLLHVAEKQKQESEPTSTANKDEFSGVTLDRKIEEAFKKTDERASAKVEFAAAQERFAALRAENPALTWKAFSESTVQLDRELWRDPSFANRLMAASGVPVTALQGETAKVQAQQSQELGAIAGLMTEMEKRGELLSLEQYAPAMAQLWQRQDFVKTGDVRQDLRRANRIVELLELDRLQKMERQSAVEKARRAGPVKSSGGVSRAGAGRGSLDSILSNATAHLSGD